MIRNIAVAGQARFGKDTLADKLADVLNANIHDDNLWHRTAFANNVKKVYMETFGVDLKFIEKWKTNSECPPGFDMNVRKSLQLIGDGFRQIKNDIWMDLVFKTNRRNIISDTRYINEFKRTKQEQGINIIIIRPDFFNDDESPSESQIKPYCEYAFSKMTSRSCDFLDLRHITKEYEEENSLIKDFHHFDFAIRNDEGLDELYSVIEKKLYPIIKEMM